LTLTGRDELADCVCDSKSALNSSTATGACTTVPAGSVKTGGIKYTTADGTTFVLAGCDDTMGYVATPASSACTACTGTGCTTCAAGALGTCLGCRAGFRDTATDATFTCVACAIANCATCDSSGTSPANSEKCLTAKDGFYLDANSAVQPCPTNATKCTFSSGTVTVTAVAAGYYIKSGALTVATACPNGKSSAANSDAAQADGGATSCTIACATTCLNCNTAGVGKCDVCPSDNYIDTAATDVA